MIRKILFFFLLSLSFTCFYSQKDLSISLEGKVQNKENKENIFGATLYLMDKEVFISKSVSLSNGTFLLTAKIPRSDTYDLIVSKKACLPSVAKVISSSFTSGILLNIAFLSCSRKESASVLSTKS